jgi:hypothetical protein
MNQIAADISIPQAHWPILEVVVLRSRYPQDKLLPKYVMEYKPVFELPNCSDPDA